MIRIDSFFDIASMVFCHVEKEVVFGNRGILILFTAYVNIQTAIWTKTNTILHYD